MTRKNTVTTKHDSAGDYEVEIFDYPNPKRMIVCSHGSGVRRWDGEKFFYAVAEHYAGSAVLLVDQNQQEGEYVKMNPLPIIVERVQGLLDEARQLHPGTPIVVMGHSMGCGVAALLELEDVSAVVLVTPAFGTPVRGYVERYGDDVVNGKRVTTSDGFKKDFTAEFMASMQGVTWDDRYRKLVARFSPVYVFEAGDDDVLGEDRRVLRSIPFTKYEIIPGAKHNLAGAPLADLFAKLDALL